MKKFTKKRALSSFLGIFAVSIMPILLTSCSTNFVERTVSKNDGSMLDSNTSLQTYAQAALESDTGMKGYLDNIVNSMIVNWLNKLSKTSNVNFSNSWVNQSTTIDDDYKNLVNSYKSKYGDDWALKFQQEVLDLNGATEETYKQAKWNSWAKSQFETYLFNKNYLTYKNASGAIVNPSILNSSSVADLYNALASKSLLFAFPSNSTIDNTSTGARLTSDAIDNAYANFVNYVWQQYVQTENPYVVDMVLWKYGTPSQGLQNLYTNASSTTTSSSDSSGSGSGDSSTNTDGSTTTNSLKLFKSKSALNADTDTTSSDSSGSGDGSSSSFSTTATAASYIYPYFGNDGPNSTTGTLTKYISFVKAAASTTAKNVNFNGTGSTTTSVTIPFDSSYDSKGFGLLNIPNDYTDDSSTYILAKNSTIYNDLYTEFAAASSYLFWLNSNITDNNVNFDANTTTAQGTTASKNYGIPKNSAISKAMATTSTSASISSDTTTGLDPITKEFVSKTQIFGNASTQGGTGGSSTTNNSAANQYQLKLDSSYVNHVINSNGPLKGLTNGDLYVVDAFNPSNNNLTNYMLLRNSAGVHAISIDGINFINNDTSGSKTSLTPAEKKTNAGQVVLFRSLYNNINAKDSNYSFAVDVQSELKTYYENNLDWLIYSYALQNPTNPLFNLADIKLSDNEKNSATSINNFLHEVNYYKKVDEYDNKLIDAKKTYSSNYGVNDYQNGLAALWPYATLSITDANKYDSNPYLSFQVAATDSIVYNPFASNVSVTKNYDGTDYVSKTSLFSTLTTLSSGLSALSNVNFDGFKYSQYIYSNSSFVNAALLSYSNEGTDLADLAKISYLKKYIGSFFDFDKLQFNTYSITYKNTSHDISTYLNSALSNFFFNSGFDPSSANVWLNLSNTDNNNWNNAINGTTASGTTTQNTSVAALLSNYKKKLWIANNAVLNSTSLSNYLKLYSVVATIKYMLQNNANYFLTSITNQIKLGETAFVAWQGSINTNLQQSTSVTAQSVLDATKINRNVNNSFASAYIGGYGLINSISSTTLNTPFTINYASKLSGNYTTGTTPNLLLKSSYQNANTTASYYTVASNMTGFLGLQTSSSNSLATILSDLLFNNPNTDNPNLTGILYGYGSSLNTVIDIINNTTSLSAVNDIANNLAKQLNQSQLAQFADDNSLSLSQKKTDLVNAINNLSSASGSLASGIFQPRNGIVNKDVTDSATNKNGLLFSQTDPYDQFVGYTIQINRTNLTSLDNLLTALSSNNGSSDTDKTNDALDIFANLVMQQATSDSIQSDVLPFIIATQGKIDAFDVRLFSSLGAEWLANWKITNSDSSSSTSASDSSSSSSSSTSS
ncbi:MAG: hypothetical protein HUJ42_01420 [Malacoplasma sp.]|nr:hypothetical protein [Malacoplasma sp.]